MTAYYNEFKPEAAHMLRQLIKDGLIAPGVVDERSITEIDPNELRDFTQCHFFAGIGGWSVALRLAGWSDDRPVWTGSCPCQPFSTAGKQKGKADERHLWPVWFKLIRECRPSVVFGEQVAAAITHGWWDDVANDMEGEGYACGAAVLPACSVGKPHKRDRLWFVGNSESVRGGEGQPLTTRGFDRGSPRQISEPIQPSAGVVGNTEHNGRHESAELGSIGESKAQRGMQQFEGSGEPCVVANGAGARLEGRSGPSLQGRGVGSTRGSVVGNTEHNGQPALQVERGHRQAVLNNTGGQDSTCEFAGTGQPSDVADTERWGRQGQGALGESKYTEASRDGQTNQPFDDSSGERIDWIACPDGKSRPVKRGVRLLAHGVQHRTPILHAFGNAIVPEIAAAFIQATQEARDSFSVRLKSDLPKDVFL